ncbi:MAG: nuclear transport factor 2 family protein [Opitutus sp.]|nr:nuclear transport factor 2 family protein [Opitutus sp.]
MKITLFRLLPFLALLGLPLRAAGDAISTKPDAKTMAALNAADEERVGALLSGDRARLTAIFSDDLYFVHASGKRDTKASYIEVLATKQTVYSKYTYKEREFSQLAPGIVQMAGRILLMTKTGELDLNFLSIWRLEGGQWRFLSWQSSRNNPPAAAVKSKT